MAKEEPLGQKVELLCFARPEPEDRAVGLQERVAVLEDQPPAVRTGKERVDPGLVAPEHFAAVKGSTGKDERRGVGKQGTVIHGGNPVVGSRQGISGRFPGSNHSCAMRCPRWKCLLHLRMSRN